MSTQADRHSGRVSQGNLILDACPDLRTWHLRSTDVEPADAAEVREVEALPITSDLEKYLLLPQEPLGTDVLGWWKKRDHALKADPESGRPEGLPHLARMARQWLGCPGTSAGVERLFSKAGSMHHDLKGSMEDGSLEHSLIATANTE